MQFFGEAMGAYYREKTHEAIKGRFRKKKAVASRMAPRYPSSAEREYRRLNRAYTRIIGDSLREHLPGIMEAYDREMRKDSREDGVFEFLADVRQRFMDMVSEIEEKLEQFKIEKAVEKVSRMAQEASIREWKRVVKYTLGVDILDDYYKGDKYEQAIQHWVSGNVSKIKSLPAQTLLGIERIIEDAYRQGKPLSEVSEELQKEYALSKQRADMLARDQMSTLNAQMTQMQHQDAGVKKYKWRSSRDSYVRDCHRVFDGNIYSWDDPPDDWYLTKSRGVVYTGHKYNPGMAMCCRCTAIPIFEYEKTELPIKQEEAIYGLHPEHSARPHTDTPFHEGTGKA